MNMPQDPDERRVQHLLREQARRRNEKPITPSRIIPAGVPLPARAPEPGEAPPWRTQPAAPPPAPPAQPPVDWHRMPPPPERPIAVRVTVDLVYSDPEPDPTWRERLVAWVARNHPWHALAALALAVFPIPFTGFSTATTWAYTVSEARDAFGTGQGYALAGVPLAVAVWRLRKGGTFLRVFGFAVFLVGLTGGISLYDPVTLITGVTP